MDSVIRPDPRQLQVARIRMRRPSSPACAASNAARTHRRVAREAVRDGAECDGPAVMPGAEEGPEAEIGGGGTLLAGGGGVCAAAAIADGPSSATAMAVVASRASVRRGELERCIATS